jgi:prepilin-type N-terminal cleavage/methylation domain-containing protein
MISNVYSHAIDASDASDQHLGLQKIRGLRKPFIPRAPARPCPTLRDRALQAGFTLIELMIVLGVITIVAVIAFAGIRNNQWEGAYMRFTDDLVGTMIQARNRAIDDQTIVRVEVAQDRVEVFWIDPEAPVPDPTVMGSGTFLWGNYRDRIDGGLIADHACITGMEAGISPPSEPNNAQMPIGCGTNLPKSILFQPDGSFALEDEPLPDTGMTLVVQDASSNQVWYSIIEMFPGGLIRKFDEIPAP